MLASQTKDYRRGHVQSLHLAWRHAQPRGSASCQGARHRGRHRRVLALQDTVHPHTTLLSSTELRTSEKREIHMHPHRLRAEFDSDVAEDCRRALLAFRRGINDGFFVLTCHLEYVYFLMF